MERIKQHWVESIVKMLYTVWVGGTEVNDHYLDNIYEARLLARQYVFEGYTDVCVEAFKKKTLKERE